MSSRSHGQDSASLYKNVRLAPVTVIFLTLLFSPPSSAFSAEQPAGFSLQKVAAELDSVKSQQADILSPRAYARALEEYRRLADLARRGRAENEWRPVLQQFHQALDTAMRTATLGKRVLGNALAARSRAISVSAPEVAAKEYQSAQSTFNAAVAKLESNNLREAEKIGREAASKYRQAESSAVRINLLGAARAKMAEAKSRKADEYAPKTYGRAQALIREIEAAMDTGNASPEELQMKTSLAEYEARHALYLATVLDTLRRSSTNWERILLEEEQIVSRMAEPVGMHPTFENGVQAPVDSVISMIRQMQESLIGRLALREADVARLSREIDSLRTSFDQQQIRLAAMIEQYQTDLQARKEELELKRRELEAEIRKKMQLDAIDQAEHMFLKNEAVLLREGKSLIIRLIGLNFPAGATTIPRDSFPLLDKLGKVIALFAKNKIAVEGHTAATGNEKTNLAQSESRANAVREYLISKAGIPESRIVAVGFGGARPITDNVTPQGRAQNRRIDVLIALED